MKRVWSIVISAMICIGLAATSVFAAYDAYRAYSQMNEDFRVAVEKLPPDDFQAYRDYFEKSYPNQLPKYDAAIHELESTGVTGDYDLAQAIKNSRTKLVTFHEAIVSGDDAKITATGQALDDANTAEVDLANKQVQQAADEDSSLLWLYGGLTGLFTVLAVGTWWWAHRARSLVTGSKYDEKASQLMHDRRMGLFYATLFGLGGAAVTLIWYLAIRENGGTYMIFYGPIIFGTVIFIKGVIEYRRKSVSQGFIKEVKRQEDLTASDGSTTVNGYMMDWKRAFRTHDPLVNQAIPAVLVVMPSDGSVTLKPTGAGEIVLRQTDIRMLQNGSTRLVFTTKQKKNYIFGLRKETIQVSFWQSLRQELAGGPLTADERTTQAIIAKTVSSTLNTPFNRIRR